MNIITKNHDLNCHICSFCKYKLLYRYYFCFNCHKEIKQPRYLLDLIIPFEERVTKIDTLLSLHYCSDWEKEFLRSVREQKIFSAKQINALNNIFKRKTGNPIINVDDFL